MAPAPSDNKVAIRAALDGNLRLLKKMAKKVDLRVVKDKGHNVLHAAAGMGRLEVCKYLVEEMGLDVNSATAEGVTPTFLAAIDGSIPVIQYLLGRGGDPAVPTSRGAMALHNAAEFGHCDAVRLLLSKGVPVDPVDHRGTPLHLAAAKDQDQTMKILLEHGADPDRVVHHLFSPLVMACTTKSLKCMKLLVQAGADVNFKSSSGPSALMYAVNNGFTDIVKFLLEVGADPNIPDHYGKIPIMCAADCEQRELVEILFPQTRPVPSLPDWSDEISVEDDIANKKAKGNELFAKGEYLSAIYFYGTAANRDPLDATLFANLSLCWLRMGEGNHALADAVQCRMLRPRWSKAWYREGAALSLIKNYKGAIDAFMEALKLDPTNDEIKKALRDAMEAMKSAAPL
ncbi:unnamed protein product [Urochloa decumbens]|uniref:Uncharacterized protein n=1 Tax=Urochloa decumbens TaxID=240449 RepID=A0ABC8VWP4_9POAL